MEVVGGAGGRHHSPLPSGRREIATRDISLNEQESGCGARGRGGGLGTGRFCFPDGTGAWRQWLVLRTAVAFRGAPGSPELTHCHLLSRTLPALPEAPTVQPHDRGDFTPANPETQGGGRPRSSTCNAWKCPAGGGLAFPLLVQKLLKTDFTQNNKNLGRITQGREHGSSGHADPTVFLLVSETTHVPLRTQHRRVAHEVFSRDFHLGRQSAKGNLTAPSSSAALGGAASGPQCG